MATFAFIQGVGDVGWYWHLVGAELRALGHDTVAPDLPIEDDTAGLPEYAAVVVEAIQGESAEEMFTNTRWEPEQLQDSSAHAVFYYDVPRELADEALSRGRRQSDTPGRQPWPLEAWPAIATRFVLCRNDRFFPARWLRPVVRDRLGLEPVETDSGHCPALSRPRELAGLLDRYATEAISSDRSA
jgi:hypothetical protein